jgi:FkbM family methyltransferase
MIDFYEQFINPGDLVFDIGANIGDRTAAFREMDARVVAVEPHPACVGGLWKRFIGDRGTTVVQCAISNHEGVADLISGDCPSVSSISEEWIATVQKTNRFPGHAWNTRYGTTTTTLDRMIEQYGRPSFIKIDVEGWEAAVILGLSTPVNALSFEFHPEFLPETEKCVRKLESLGMSWFNYSLEESFQFNTEWTSGNNILALLHDLDPKLYGDVYARL